MLLFEIDKKEIRFLLQKFAKLFNLTEDQLKSLNVCIRLIIKGRELIGDAKEIALNIIDISFVITYTQEKIRKIVFFYF